MCHRCKALYIGLAFLLVGPQAALASILTFDQDPPVTNFERVDQAYGDRVTSTTMPGNFLYGEAGEGFTPNVVVDYGPTGSLPSLWTTGYADLVNALFEDQDGFGVLEVSFTADPGFNVNIYSWDMGAFGGNQVINSLGVRDSEGNVLFEQSNAAISGTTGDTFAFSEPFVDNALTLFFDSSNLGSLSDNIAFDNIRFAQSVVPVPATLALFGSGLLGLLGIARRKKA